MTSAPFREKFTAAIVRAGVPICVGLDPDPDRIPPHLGRGVMAAYQFLTSIIEATRDAVAAFKPNTAYFEAYGHEGWALLEKLRDRAGQNVLWIVDAKRGDVEHTNEAYARALFDILKADAMTAQPYLGMAALEPFYRDPAHGVFVLCATSNPGAEEMQSIPAPDSPTLLEYVAKRVVKANVNRNLGLVVGTTKPEALNAVLGCATELPLLLPGGGAQGGDTKATMQRVKQAGATGLFNFSRSVIYKSPGKDFAEAARGEVENLQALLR
jgi:orotidine-5'-phosphate decarboxylase